MRSRERGGARGSPAAGDGQGKQTLQERGGGGWSEALGMEMGLETWATRTHEEQTGEVNTDAPTSKSTPPVHFQSCCSHVPPGPTLPVTLSRLTPPPGTLFTSSPSPSPAHLSPGPSLSSSSSSLRKLKLSRACSTVMLRLEARLRVRPCFCWGCEGSQRHGLAAFPVLPQPSPAILTISRLSSRVTSCSRPCSSGNWPR